MFCFILINKTFWPQNSKGNILVILGTIWQHCSSLSLPRPRPNRDWLGRRRRTGRRVLPFSLSDLFFSCRRKRERKTQTETDRRQLLEEEAEKNRIIIN